MKMTAMYLRMLGIGATMSAALLAAPFVDATSTDGYHKIQVIPVAVKSTAYKTSFFVHNPTGTANNVKLTFYRGADFTGSDPVPGPSYDCGQYVIQPGRVLSFADLPTLCPAVAGPVVGSLYGWLWAEEVTPASTLPFTIFTRVDNNANTSGFEVEGYPAHTFTGASGYVIGLRRSTAGPGLKTNCFAAALNEPTTVTLTLLDGAGGATLAAPITVNLPATQMVRFLDIFSGVGQYSNAMLNVVTSPTPLSNPPQYPGSIVFCTVENLTTTDADFRIAKAYPVFDNHVQRFWLENVDEAGVPYKVGTFPNERSRHVVYFKHPDVIECALGGANVGSMEVRLYDPEGTLRAGGSGITSFTGVYTGDKGAHGQPGTALGLNGKWLIDVQGRDGSVPADATYAIACRSGSGHGGYEWIGRSLPHV